VPSQQISFGGCWRRGAAQPDLRVTLPILDLGLRTMPLKDHFLIQKVEHLQNLDDQSRLLKHAIQSMGESVAVRLGLSRAFPGGAAPGEPVCWLMADGFFSLIDPQS
jgi:hypothetical protein